MRFFLFLVLVLHLPISAQNITGRAFYTSFYQFDDPPLQPNELQDPLKIEMAEQLKKPFIDQYELEFTQEESIFKKLQKLDVPEPKKTGISISISVMDEQEILYKNLKENKLIKETEFHGKQFLIQDDIEITDWQLSKESRTIGNYICFKATYVPKRDSSETEQDKLEDSTPIVAWYTPQIPVKNGPQNYQGLPGLILEIQAGELKFLCTKIVLNPEEKVVITKPRKGKKVNQKEFSAIMNKKAEEMMESFKTPKRRD